MVRVMEWAKVYDASTFLLLRPSCHSEASEASPKNLAEASEASPKNLGRA
jgi:hypothetical protein